MNVVEAIFALCIAAVGTWMAIAGISRGVIKGGDGYAVSRIERPARFWLELVIGGLISAICVAFAVWRLSVA